MVCVTSSSLRKKCPYSELFWSVFSFIRTEYREILCISPYSARMWENADQNNSEYENFSRNAYLLNGKCYNPWRGLMVGRFRLFFEFKSSK